MNNYTPEGLRAWADWWESGDLSIPPSALAATHDRAHLARAHAAALERIAKLEKYKAFVDWIGLYGVSLTTVADERGSYRLDWYRGQCFGNTMEELMEAVEKTIAENRADLPKEPHHAD